MNRYETQLTKLPEVVVLTDNHGGVKAAITPHAGGELSSLQILWQDVWRETLYRANDFQEVQGWRGRAPILWPAVGRNYTAAQLQQIKQSREDVNLGSYTIGNQTYSMPTHGFAMNLPWTLCDYEYDDSKAWARCVLQSDEYTRQFYPFDFTFSVTYTVTEGILLIQYCVTPGPQNTQAMFFSIANHITFQTPFTQHGSFAEMVFSAPTKQHSCLTPQSLLSGDTQTKDFTQGVPLNDETLHNMVVSGFERDNAWVQLIDPYAFGFRISQRGWVDFDTGFDTLRYSTQEATQSKEKCAKPSRCGGNDEIIEIPSQDYYFVLYGHPENGLFCPEPWLGGPNSLNTKEGVVWLEHGEQFRWEIQIST